MQISRNVYSRVLAGRTYFAGRLRAENHTCSKRTAACDPYRERSAQLLHGLDSEWSDQLTRPAGRQFAMWAFRMEVAFNSGILLYTDACNDSHGGRKSSRARGNAASRNSESAAPSARVVSCSASYCFSFRYIHLFEFKYLYFVNMRLLFHPGGPR